MEHSFLYIIYISLTNAQTPGLISLPVRKRQRYWSLCALREHEFGHAFRGLAELGVPGAARGGADHI